MDTSSPKPRLRLAPSPTGFLHLGNFRTALFGYLLAKKWGGDFILRIEDTDSKREVEGAVESLLSVFAKMGLRFDEGPQLGGPVGPYIQSERLEIYREHAQRLVSEGKAYYCFATPEELEAMRAEQTAAKLPPRYDRRYRDVPLAEAKERAARGDTYVIRHKMPLSGDILVHDELRGDITFPAAELDDYVLLKSDGGATYQLASVVDDHLMGITHVTRGDEWIPSLPKNITLYADFGWKPPVFIHWPLILNKGGGKLSKRQGDVFVEDYLAKGYLPEAIINFCALLGWHPKDEQEFFTLAELEQVFDLNGLGTSPAVFDTEKLDSINAQYIRRKTPAELLPLALPFLEPYLVTAASHKKESAFLEKAVAIEQSRLKNVSEIGEAAAFLFLDSIDADPALLVWKKMTPEQTAKNLQELVSALEHIPADDWSAGELERIIVTQLKAEEKPLGDYLWPMRVALSGKKASPGPFEIAAILEKDEALAKIKQAIGILSENVL